MPAGLSVVRKMGLSHGMARLDNVMVCASRTCRLHHHFLRSAQCRQFSHHVSLAMATGQPPTLQYGICCYELLCTEAVSRRPC
ncbi:hypothetical protein N2W54_000977 [Lotmaria passim]